MPSIFKFIVIFGLIYSPLAFAANKVGNGGLGVFCEKRNQLLDFYEGEISSKAEEENAYDEARRKLNQLQKKAPELAKQYKRRLKQIKSEIKWVKDVSLMETKDSLHLYEPKLKTGCRVLQLAIRKADPLPNEKKFIIRKDLWNRLDTSNRAGLLIHEIIYEHFSKLGEENSKKARKMNAFLFSKDFAKKPFWNFIRNLEIPLYP